VKHLNYISLGAGAQSSYLYVGSCDGIFPPADVAIFADTQDEPAWVYEQLDALRRYGNHKIPIKVVTAGCISDDAVARNAGTKKRFAAIPSFTMGEDGKAAPLRRQCTREYKIQPIQTAVRRMLGCGFGERIGKRTATCYIGISREEIYRIKDSRDKWIENRWPLVDANIRRADCIREMTKLGFQEMRRSACVFCPYHDDYFWANLKKSHPEEFEKAVKFDRAIREMSITPIHGATFLHRSLIPLEEVRFKPDLQPSFNFNEECEGMCGV
jgi:hypothetical protein